MVYPMKYYVYVIRLDNVVLKSRKFRSRNPVVDRGLSCFYVGQSCHPPEIRFWQHKTGYKGNQFVKKYGLGLCPRIYEQFNPIMNREEAEHIEARLTETLRRAGHGVWSN